MPTYDYECAACGRRFEVVHGVHADGPTACPLCGKGPVRKVITAANVHYKGSGWAKKERRSTVSSGASKGGAGGGVDGAKDHSKSEAAASSDADGSGPSSKKSETGSTATGVSKATEKTSSSGASKTSD
jgi:putative FmdB family regulatory protein